MLAKHRMRHLAVRDYLYRAVIVFELLLGNDIRIMAMHRAINTDDTLHHTRNRTYIV